MKLLPDDYEPTEMMCSASEYMHYNKQKEIRESKGGAAATGEIDAANR